MYFDELDLDDGILDGIDAMNFQEMTPVQEAAIPVILEGRDLIGCAQTGTGKTAAYTLPLLDRLVRNGNPDNVIKAVIVVPTRELAMQIDTQFQGFSYYTPISTTVVYGGGDGKGWDVQKRGMLSGADVVIATPGRLIAHIQNSGVDLSHVEYLILDEADRMLDMGFFDDIMKIVGRLPEERQTLLFSATLPPKIRQLAKQILRNPAEINIAISKPNEAIDQSAYVCYERQKMGIIRALFGKPLDTKTIIFSSSKQTVKELAFDLRRKHFNAAAMHSDLDQQKREEVMLDFKNGKIDLLVATDIVARGIDIEDIGTVINYDVPRDPEDYIHRIGRTARASATGRAITFVSETEQGKFHKIERFIEREIPKNPLPEEVGEGPVYEPDNDRDGRGGKSGRGGKGGRGKGKGSRKETNHTGDTAQDRGRGRGEGNRGSRDRRRPKPAPAAAEPTPTDQPQRPAGADTPKAGANMTAATTISAASAASGSSAVSGVSDASVSPAVSAAGNASQPSDRKQPAPEGNRKRRRHRGGRRHRRPSSAPQADAQSATPEKREE